MTTQTNRLRLWRARSWLMLCLVLGAWLCPVNAQDTTPVDVNIVFGGEDEGEEELLPLGGGCALRSSLCEAERTRFDVFNQLVLPPVKTRVELSAERTRDAAARRYQPRLDTSTEQAIAQASGDTQRWYEPRIFGAALRYESVDVDRGGAGNLDGDVYSTLMHARWGLDNISYGILLPYEFLDLDSFNAHRIGFVLYGQYHYPVSALFSVGVTLNGNYRFTSIDDNRFENLNAFGTGVALSLEFDQEQFHAGLACLYNYAKDDSHRLNDEQHLVSVGANVGMQVGESVAFTAFAMWNYDLTEEDSSLPDTDDDYFDVGLEGSWSLTASWKLTGGYKKVLFLKDFDSNMVFIGTLLRF